MVYLIIDFAGDSGSSTYGVDGFGMQVRLLAGTVMYKVLQIDGSTVV